MNDRERAVNELVRAAEGDGSLGSEWQERPVDGIGQAGEFGWRGGSMAIGKRKAAKEDTRAVKRCPMVASAEVTDIASNTRLAVRTSEIAIGGCYVDAMNPFPAGTAVRIRIVRDQGTFEAKAKVVYCDSTMGMGLAFTEIAPQQRSVLEDWLVEIVKPAP